MFAYTVPNVYRMSNQ